MSNTKHIIHSKQTMEFPPETRKRIESAQAARQPRAVPSANTNIAKAVPNTAGVTHNGRPAAPRVPMTAQQQNMASIPMGAIDNSGIDPELIATVKANNWYEPPRPTAAPMMKNAVQNPRPGFVVPKADANGASLDLPSRFAFYPFQDLYVVPFRNGHLAKIQRAAAEVSLQPIVEVVSSVIYTSTPGFDNIAPMLTMPDFYFILYWLRQNSYTKSNFMHTTMCKNPEHIKAVNEGHKHKDSLKITKIIDKGTIKVHQLETLPDPEIYKFNDDTPLVLNPPCMADVLAFMDSPHMADPNTRIEYAYLAQQAAHTQGRDQYLTLDQRIELIENITGDEVVLLEEYQEMMSNYGVEEKVMVNCKECGASQESTISLDAHSFLSSK